MENNPLLTGKGIEVILVKYSCAITCINPTKDSKVLNSLIAYRYALDYQHKREDKNIQKEKKEIQKKEDAQEIQGEVPWLFDMRVTGIYRSEVVGM
jgi:hypothetical protein